MKRMVRVMMSSYLLFAVLNVSAQSTVTKLKSVIEPLRLAIGSGKTTNLIFPYSITSVDRGSKQVMAQKAAGVENILQIKAAGEYLKETNLTVITADGSLYSFLLSYTAEPMMLNFNLGLNEQGQLPLGILPAGNDNEARIRQLAGRLATRLPTITRLKDKKEELLLRLSNIFIQDAHFYFQLAIVNNSNIRYDVDQLRFFVNDQKRSKRTASQERELQTTYIYGNAKQVEPHSVQVLVFAMPKFTIPDHKYLLVQLMEKNGGGHLRLKIFNRLLKQCKRIY